MEVKKYTKIIVTGISIFGAYIFWTILEEKTSEAIVKWFDSLGLAGKIMEVITHHVVSTLIFIVGYVAAYMIGREDAKKDNRVELEAKENALVEREKLKDSQIVERDKRISEFEHERDGRLKILESCLKITVSNETRYFTWRPKGPVHMLSEEGSINPLNNFEPFLSNAILALVTVQPRWHSIRDIRSDCVYEITNDGRSKHKVSGGPANMSGLQVMVIVPNGRP
jgi:hypothetical protein